MQEKQEGAAIKISAQTREKIEAVKLFIERTLFHIFFHHLNLIFIGKYSKLTQDDQEKKKNWKLLEEKMEKLNMSFHEKESIKQEILHKQSEKLRKKSKH